MKKAFTLVEIIFVLGMIAILIGMAVPAIKGMDDESKLSKVEVDLSILQSALDAYALRYDQYPSAGIEGNYQQEIIRRTGLLKQEYLDPFTGIIYRYLRPDSQHFVLVSPGINREYEFDPIADIMGNMLKKKTDSDDQIVTNYLTES